LHQGKVGPLSVVAAMFLFVVLCHQGTGCGDQAWSFPVGGVFGIAGHGKLRILVWLVGCRICIL